MHIARLKQKDLGRFDSSCIRYSALYWITHTARITAVQLPCTYSCNLDRSEDQRIRGSEDQRIRESEDQRIRGSEDQGIRESENQRIRESEDQRIKGSGNQRIRESEDQRIRGELNVSIGRGNPLEENTGGTARSWPWLPALKTPSEDRLLIYWTQYSQPEVQTEPSWMT